MSPNRRKPYALAAALLNAKRPADILPSSKRRNAANFPSRPKIFLLGPYSDSKESHLRRQSECCRFGLIMLNIFLRGIAAPVSHTNENLTIRHKAKARTLPGSDDMQATMQESGVIGFHTLRFNA